MTDSTGNSSEEVSELRRKIAELEGRLAFEAQERQEMEKWLLAARQSALEASRAKSTFVANMSHEIRTPIHAITGMLYALGETPLSEQQRKYTTIIQRATESLVVLLNDILDFSKMEAGKLSLNFAEQDLRECITLALEMFARQARSKGLKWTLDLDPRLAPRYRTDADRVRQVLANMVSNAIKFTSSGEITVRVFEESRERHQSWVRLEVQDTGIGIPQSARSLIFEQFSQVDDSFSRKHGGAGLGLSICRRLVELLGGTIGFDSEEGKGTVFWFAVPMEFGAEAGARIESAPAAAPPATPKTGRILVVEDNPVNQEVTASLLEGFGHQVEIAGSGKQALDKIKRASYDLVLMDCQMPEMDGYEATGAIREWERGSGRKTPIIALTANAMKDATERCLQAGMNDYLAKPVDVLRMRDKIQVWLPEAGKQQAEGASQAAESVIELAAIEKLKEFRTSGKPNLFVKLVEIYLSDGPPRAERMRKAIHDGDSKTLSAEGHYLKSASATLGARRLSQICLALEDIHRHYDEGRALRLFSDFEEEFGRACEELRKLAGL